MFDERVLKHAPWSISKANLVDLCGVQYLHKYVDKVKEGAKSTESRVGVVLHEILEVELKGPGADLDKHFRAAIEKETLTTEEQRDIQVRLTAISEFGTRIRKYKEAKGVTRELNEFKLAIRSDFTGTNFFDKGGLLRGVIDYAMITRDGVMILIDHKSGRKKKIDEHSTQFFAYMLMVIANFSAIRGVQCGVNYIGADKIDWFPRMNGESGAWTRDEIGQLKTWLSHYLNKSARKLQLIDERIVEPETGWQCGYCGYIRQCDKGQQEMERRRLKRDGGKENL